MAPQEKAKDLIKKFDETFIYIESDSTAKECALIAIDELIIQEERYNNGTFYPSKYWKQVKQEIYLL